ncbi:MAG TPA: helix-hairpin-helix domain-containing protein [Candidatus Methanoperedens sp.]|nr:helix-hairpin-helix domain-containing protein [Candidatus Methanoperedens sp.]
MKTILMAALLLALPLPTLAAAEALPAPTVASAAAPSQRLVDVNRASVAELIGIPGIGERLAEAIVELRKRKGSFTSLGDLLEVRGIGEKSLALIGERLMIGTPQAASAGGGTSPAK